MSLVLSIDVNVASTILANGRSHGGHTIHLFIWSSTNILSYKIRFYLSPIHSNSLYLRADVFTCLFFVETSSISNSSKFSLSAILSTTKLCLQHLRYIIFGSVHTRSVHMSRSNSIRVLWPMADSLLFTLISLPENHLKIDFIILDLRLEVFSPMVPIFIDSDFFVLLFNFNGQNGRTNQ